MISSLRINDRYQTYSCWLAARRPQARIRPLNSQTSALAITPYNAQRAQSHQPAHPRLDRKIISAPVPHSHSRQHRPRAKIPIAFLRHAPLRHRPPAIS